MTHPEKPSAYEELAALIVKVVPEIAHRGRDYLSNPCMDDIRLADILLAIRNVEGRKGIFAITDIGEFIYIPWQSQGVRYADGVWDLRHGDLSSQSSKVHSFLLSLLRV